MTKNWKLWLDDERNPQFFLEYEYGRNFKDENYVWALNVEQAQYYVGMWGMPEFMALDHDLGQETTMEFLKWFQQEYPDDAPPPYRCHTANPIGKENMVSFLESWKKSVYRHST